jgi:hypothetical protein
VPPAGLRALEHGLQVEGSALNAGVHLDAAVLHDLDQLAGVQIVEVLDFYDGPLDGLARYQDRDYWFSAVPERIRGVEPRQPRIYVLHEITADQASKVHAESLMFIDFAHGKGGDDAWKQAWESRSTFDEASPIGWFHED